MTIAPNTLMVTMLAVSGWPPNEIQLVAEDRRDADHAARHDRAVRRAKTRVHRPKHRGQIAGARQREDLPRVAEDDAVERGDEPEQPEPHQHVQPAAVLADDGLHRLRQRVVDVGRAWSSRPRRPRTASRRPRARAASICPRCRRSGSSASASFASSAAIATPSMARKNQIANGIAANMPGIAALDNYVLRRPSRPSRSWRAKSPAPPPP